MASVTRIYALVDPRDGQVRYIGKTDCPLSLRLSRHISTAKSDTGSCHRLNWLRELLALGLRPEIRELESNPADWAAAEARWIQYGLSQGWDLTNSTLGGEGFPTVDYSQVDPLLGTMPDADVAALAGCSSTTVYHRRIALGVPDYRSKNGIPRLKKKLPLEAIAQLGKVPDMRLASAYGVSPQTIARARAERGIPPAVPPGGVFRKKLPPEGVALLGVLSDPEIARRFNVSNHSVYYLRRCLGIPSRLSKEVI